MLAMGDFNEILHLEERKGGLVCQGSMEEFKAWV